MKKLISLLLLAAITATAHADNNAKPNKVKQPAKRKAQHTAYPYSTVQTTTFNTDTTTTPLPQHNDQQQGKGGYWEYDSRMGRSMSVDPSKQPHYSNPYQGATNNPIKPVKE
jgi:hypothetical protein